MWGSICTYVGRIFGVDAFLIEAKWDEEDYVWVGENIAILYVGT